MIWRATLGRAVFCSSITLALGAGALGTGSGSGHFTALATELGKTHSSANVVSRIRQDQTAMADPDVAEAFKEARGATTPAYQAKLAQRLQAMVNLRAMTEGASAPTDAEASAKTIKSSVLYRDVGVAEDSNWLGKAFERLRNIHLHLNRPEFDPPNLKLPGIGQWLVPILWGMLALGAAVLIYLGARHIDWKSLSRRAPAVLAEDESERTLDEWLEEADRLSAQGQYREAVRALYLACLLRFDEHRIARFDRRETNWEHLRRIHRSPKRPEGLDFTIPTKAFDRIWYGKDTEGLADVERFRGWYNEYVGLLRGTRT